MHLSRPIVWAFCVPAAMAAFGITSSGNNFVVDTAGGLIYSVDKTNGNVVSMKFNGIECQDSTKFSHINSGLGSSTVTGSVVNGYTRIQITSNSEQSITHYIVSKSGDPTMFMATYINTPIDVGELRWIARLKKDAVPNGYRSPVADTSGGTAIEGSDVYLVNGQTRSKFYSSERFIEDNVHGVTGNNVGIFMIIPPQAMETSSGGPFFRDINNQNGGINELYFYMRSGHVQTELEWRMGLKGPYAMKFTTGSAPSANIDTNFFSSLNIMGYVAQANRGRVTGTVSGIASGTEAVLHWYNADNQYWVKASSNSFTSPYMKPGTYTMKLYKKELEVASKTVTVTAGGTLSSNIASTEVVPTVIWRIGTFDGQPFEFKNGDKFLRMHPSDSRMSAWGGTYTVGSSATNQFPMAIFKAGDAAGGSPIVKFTLTANQLQQMVFKIGTTLSFAGARPIITVNNWSGSIPAAPPKIDSRGVTRGAYRGYGEVYTWTVPASAFVAGTNTLTIGVASGTSGDLFLSPNIIVDALELQAPAGTQPTSAITSTTASKTTTLVTTTTSRTTTAITTTTTGGSGGCSVAIYGQCGGLGWTGCTVCASGSTCKFGNDYYSQCL